MNTGRGVLDGGGGGEVWARGGSAPLVKIRDQVGGLSPSL